MSFENIKVKKIENLCYITINRPQKYNAISLATLSELEQALDQSANNNNVKPLNKLLDILDKPYSEQKDIINFLFGFVIF